MYYPRSNGKPKFQGTDYVVNKENFAGREGRDRLGIASENTKTE